MLHDDDAIYLASLSATSMRGESTRLLRIAQRLQGQNDSLVSLQDKLEQREIQLQECRDDKHLAHAKTLSELSATKADLDAATQKLADIRHAWEHAEEIGRMDTYAANTIKQALK